MSTENWYIVKNADENDFSVHYYTEEETETIETQQSNDL